MLFGHGGKEQGIVWVCLSVTLSAVRRTSAWVYSNCKYRTHIGRLHFYPGSLSLVIVASEPQAIR
jgi:hypothetical protein